MAHRSRTMDEHRARAEHILKAGGVHADAAQDKTLIKQELKKHVEGSALKHLATGGAAGNHKLNRAEQKQSPGMARALKATMNEAASHGPKLAKGGHVKGKGPKSVTINIVHGDEQAARQQGIQQGMQAGAAMAKPPQGVVPPGGMPPHPPMPPQGGPPGMPPGAPPGAAGPGGPPGMPPRPPMGPPGAPPGGMKSGGTIKVRAHTRKRGGACD